MKTQSVPRQARDGEQTCLEHSRKSRTILLTFVLLLLVSSSIFAATASFQGLGDLPGGGFKSYAFSISADGSVVVGYSVSSSGYEAFRWTKATGMVGLGDLAGGQFNSEAWDVSADGSVVVGRGYSASGKEAFRWENGQMVSLGYLPGGKSTSFAIGCFS